MAVIEFCPFTLCTMLVGAMLSIFLLDHSALFDGEGCGLKKGSSYVHNVHCTLLFEKHCLKLVLMVSNSGVARASPGGRLAHPESQNEEENK